METSVDILSLIDEFCLTIRKIPEVVTVHWSLRPGYVLKDGEQIIEKNGLKFRVTERIPKNAGRWMAKRCINTDSMVKWNTATDNLSDTLEEAVMKAVEQCKAKKQK